MSHKSLNMFFASALMLAAFGALLRTGDQGLIPPHLPLEQFPATVGQWSGMSVPLSDKEKSILAANGYASILFSRSPQEPPVLFFSAYYDHQTAEQNIHSPLNCLPSSGWAILHSETRNLPLFGRDRKPVQVNLDIIQKGLDKQLVLYWYQERGRIFPNEYWGRYYLVRDALFMRRTDGALVRVSMALSGSDESSLKTEVSFLQTIMPRLSAFIPGRTGTPTSHSGTPKLSMNPARKGDQLHG